MTSRALLIAVDTYTDEQIPDLRAPRRDVRAVAGVLSGFEVRTLSNPTTGELHRAIEVFFSSAGRDDLLLLHFAGHGFLDDRGRLRLAGRDTEKDYLSSTALLSSNIVEIAEESRSRRLVFIIDCCYSGRFLDAGARGDRSAHLAAQFPVQGKGRVVLAASGELGYAFEDRENSLFTRLMVEGLRSGAADIDGDGWVSVTDLYEYVLDRMRDVGATQRPQLLGSREGNLFLAPGRRPEPAPAAPPPVRTDPPATTPRPALAPRPTTPSPPVGPLPARSEWRFAPETTTRSVPLPARTRSAVPAPAKTAENDDVPSAFIVGAGAVLVAVIGGLVWLVVWLSSKTHLGGATATLVWILAVILAVAGILALFRRQLLWGAVLIVVAVLLGPGVTSIFN
jgi:hypothetical protein